MTIKELYEYSKVKGFENLPFRYGYIDYDGVCRLQDFYLPDFEHNTKEVIVWFSEASLKRLADKISGEVTMEYGGDGYGIDSYFCSYCKKEVMTLDMYNFCPGCGRKIVEYK